jgi:hypothetical protein
MAATPTQVKTLCDAASTAIESADWATAERKLLAAKAILVGLPNTGAAGASIQYERQSIDSLLAMVRQNQAMGSVDANGIQRVPYTYHRRRDS